jgi:hypothetical protein
VGDGVDGRVVVDGKSVLDGRGQHTGPNLTDGGKRGCERNLIVDAEAVPRLD